MRVRRRRLWIGSQCRRRVCPGMSTAARTAPSRTGCRCGRPAQVGVEQSCVRRLDDAETHTSRGRGCGSPGRAKTGRGSRTTRRARRQQVWLRSRPRTEALLGGEHVARAVPAQWSASSWRCPTVACGPHGAHAAARSVEFRRGICVVVMRRACAPQIMVHATSATHRIVEHADVTGWVIDAVERHGSVPRHGGSCIIPALGHPTSAGSSRRRAAAAACRRGIRARGGCCGRTCGAIIGRIDAAAAELAPTGAERGRGVPASPPRRVPVPRAVAAWQRHQGCRSADDTPPERWSCCARRIDVATSSVRRDRARAERFDCTTCSTIRVPAPVTPNRRWGIARREVDRGCDRVADIAVPVLGGVRESDRLSSTTWG